MGGERERGSCEEGGLGQGVREGRREGRGGAGLPAGRQPTGPPGTVPTLCLPPSLTSHMQHSCPPGSPCRLLGFLGGLPGRHAHLEARQGSWTKLGARKKGNGAAGVPKHPRRSCFMLHSADGTGSHCRKPLFELYLSGLSRLENCTASSTCWYEFLFEVYILLCVG